MNFSFTVIYSDCFVWRFCLMLFAFNFSLFSNISQLFL